MQTPISTPQRSVESVGKDFKNNESWNIFAVALVVFDQPFPMQLQLKTHSRLEGTVLSHSTLAAVITMSKVCLGHTHKWTQCKSITKLFGAHTRKRHKHTYTQTQIDILQLFLLPSPLFPFLTASLRDYSVSHTVLPLSLLVFVTNWTKGWELVS